jgi:hypothetical protein
VAIRTQLTDNVRRVITKVIEEERRVSCSCCDDVACCVYPSAAVADNSIPFANIPALVYLDEDKTISRSKVVSVTTYNLGEFGEGPEAKLYFGAQGDGVAISEGQWGIDTDGIFTRRSNCLFGGTANGFKAQGAFGWDDYADQYLLEAYGDGDFLDSVVVTRRSVCVWGNADANSWVWYANGFVNDSESVLRPAELFPQNNRWQAAMFGFGIEGFFQKSTAPLSDPDNGPAGQHDKFFNGVPTDIAIVVSEYP